MSDESKERSSISPWWLLLLVGLIALTAVSEALRNWVVAAFGLIVGAATIAYAVLTSRLVKSTDATRRAQEKATALAAESIELQIRPNVLVFVRQHRAMLYLVVANVGAGEAFDVKLRVEGNFEEAPDNLVKDARFLKEGFRYLGPTQEHGVLLANTTRPFRHVEGAVTVTYRSRAGASYEGFFPIHLEDLFGVGVLDPPEERIADSLDRIAKKPVAS